MSDRTDLTQFPTDQTNDNDVSFAGDTDMVTDQVQDAPEGDYATGEELVDYVDPANSNTDLVFNATEQYRVRNGKPRHIARAYPLANVPNISQIIKSGPGYLLGASFTGTVVFYDGNDTNGKIVMTSASGTFSAIMSPIPIRFEYGLCAKVTGPDGSGNNLYPVAYIEDVIYE